jgi:hypothetical protein
MFLPCTLNNKSQIITHYLTWQPSHVTYRLLPLTVVLNSSHQAHTPQGKSRFTSSIIIQISNFGNILHNFDIPFHITVKKVTLPNTDYAHKNIKSNFSQASPTLPEDGSQRSRNMSEFLIVF